MNNANQALGSPRKTHGLLAGCVPERGPRDPQIQVLSGKIQLPALCVALGRTDADATYGRGGWMLTPRSCKTQACEKRTEVSSLWRFK